ncbi:MAG: hypothetical protein ACFFBT_12020 [Promethearchaeota archaeon]
MKSTKKPPIPTEFFREIILITKNGEILTNVKNLIVKILLDYNQWTSFKELKDLIINSKKFKHSATRPHNIVMFLLELQSFEVLFSDKEAVNVKKRSYILNKSILPKYYKMNIEELHEKLKTVFKKIK